MYHLARMISLLLLQRLEVLKKDSDLFALFRGKDLK